MFVKCLNGKCQVKMLVDPVAGTYDGYVAGQFVGTVSLIDGQSLTHITLQREGDDNDPTYYHNGYLDALTVVPPPPPPLPPEPECGDWDYLLTDLNEDCYVDMLDFAVFASQWLDPTEG